MGNHAQLGEDSDSVVELKNISSDSEPEFPFKRQKVKDTEEEKHATKPLNSLLKLAGSPSNAPTGDEAAWEDKNDNQMSVDIMKSTRTKKLQEEHDESEITGAEYSKRLRKFQQKITETGKNDLYKWAFEDPRVGQNDMGDNMLMSLLKTNTKISSNTSFSLPKKMLDYTRLGHINEKDYHGSVVNAVQFHPTNNLMLSAGLDKRCKLYNVNHTKSIRVQSIFTKDLPIHSAAFIQNGKEIILSGARKHFYYYDLVKNDLMKVSHIFGNQEERDLKK